MLFMQKQLPYIDATTLQQHYNTNFCISNMKIAANDTVENSR